MTHTLSKSPQSSCPVNGMEEGQVTHIHDTLFSFGLSFLPLTKHISRILRGEMWARCDCPSGHLEVHHQSIFEQPAFCNSWKMSSMWMAKRWISGGSNQAQMSVSLPRPKLEAGVELQGRVPSGVSLELNTNSPTDYCLPGMAPLQECLQRHLEPNVVFRLPSLWSHPRTQVCIPHSRPTEKMNQLPWKICPRAVCQLKLVWRSAVLSWPQLMKIVACPRRNLCYSLKEQC